MQGVRIKAVLGAGACMAGLLSVALPASATTIPQTTSRTFGGYSSTFSATEGVLTLEMQVATVTCPSGPPGEVYFANAQADLTASLPIEAGVGYTCVNGQLTAEAVVQTKNSFRSMVVSSGDDLRLLVASGAGIDTADVRASLHDLTTGSSIHIERPGALSVTGFTVGVHGGVQPVTPFDPIKFRRVLWNGSPLLNSPGLQKVTLVNAKSRQLIYTGDLMPDGEAFTMTWLRSS